MVAGGAEMATTPVGLGGFCAARALSQETMIRSVRVDPGIKIVMVSYSAMALESWCSKNTSTRRSEVRIFTLN